jgi:hypothetical protein
VNWLRILCVIGLLAATAGAIDREAFTFTKYDLQVRLEPAEHRLAVRGKITVHNDSVVPQKNLTLQISSSLAWHSITFDGKPVEFLTQPYASDIDHTGALSEAIVTLPTALQPGASVDLEVGYDGIVVPDATRLTRIGIPENVARHLNWDEIGKSFTAVRGIGFVTWYPVAIEAASLSDGNRVALSIGRWKAKQSGARMKLVVTNSSDDEGTSDILCNGKRMKASTPDEGIHCEFDDLAVTVPTLAFGTYEDLNKSGITLHYLKDHKTGAENYALSSSLALPLVTEWFGAPKQGMQVIELNDPDAVSFESGNMLLTPLLTTDSRTYAAMAVHQLTHAAVTSPRPWISEGLAHFAEALEHEQNDGHEAAVDLLSTHASEVADAEKSLTNEKPADRDAEAIVRTDREVFYRSKAMCVWWMLRDLLGEDALKKALAGYHGSEDHDPAYMPRLIAAQSKRDITWFLDDWIYHDRGLPDFHVSSAIVQPIAGSGYMVTVTVENLGSAGADVPVTVKMASAEVTRSVEVMAKAKAAVRIDVPAKPESVVLNDGTVPESDMSNNTYQIKDAVK